MSRPNTRSTARRSSQAARESFLAGDQWAYLAGIIAVLLGAALVYVKFPKRDEERRLLARYREQDAPVPQPTQPAPQPVPASQPG